MLFDKCNIKKKIKKNQKQTNKFQLIITIVFQVYLAYCSWDIVKMQSRVMIFLLKSLQLREFKVFRQNLSTG